MRTLGVGDVGAALQHNTTVCGADTLQGSSVVLVLFCEKNHVPGTPLAGPSGSVSPFTATDAGGSPTPQDCSATSV